MQKDPRIEKRIVEYGGDVRFAQAYLTRYGYLAHRSYRSGELDQATSLAISRFQLFFGLSVTGKLELSALETMTILRCGLPDPAIGARFATRCAWTAAIPIGYGFLGGSTTVSDSDALTAVQSAMATWHPGDIPNVPSFQQVDPQQNPDVLIAWLKTDLDVGFDASVYAHSDFPPTCNEITNPAPPPTPMHFNDQDLAWTINPAPGLADVESIALHELGHVLGLEHSNVSGAVMFPTLALGDSLRLLSADDREGLLALYP